MSEFEFCNKKYAIICGVDRSKEKDGEHDSKTITERNNEMFDDDELFEEGWINGHDVHRDDEDGGIWYDGYYCADASDYEEAETEYWNTH